MSNFEEDCKANEEKFDKKIEVCIKNLGMVAGLAVRRSSLYAPGSPR